MTSPLHVAFMGGAEGPWRIDTMNTLIGPGLAPAERLTVCEASRSPPDGAVWTLSGTTSNLRYSTATEVVAMRARQEGLGRGAATRAALIPITKSGAWWALAQDERRRIFEETSQHTLIGMDYLPAIARRLHHCRDLGGEFDFLTWFEYAPEHQENFETLCARLRETEEWTYVVREVDIRLSRD